jgi:hypothetical protein
MTLDREDFLARLPAALGFAPHLGADGFTHRSAEQTCNCRLSPLPPLRLGSLRLARLRVEFALDGYGEEAAQAFFRRFLLAYQRGGG